MTKSNRERWPEMADAIDDHICKMEQMMIDDALKRSDVELEKLIVEFRNSPQYKTVTTDIDLSGLFADKKDQP